MDGTLYQELLKEVRYYYYLQEQGYHVDFFKPLPYKTNNQRRQHLS